MSLGPGWYADPTGRHEHRYWDGRWTEHVADAGVALVDALESSGRPSSQPAPAHVPSTDPDVERARDLMARFAASLGNNDRIWDCLAAVGTAGGFVGAEMWFAQADALPGNDVRPLMDKPWRWLLDVALRAEKAAIGDELLPAQVFLFTWMFTEQWAPNMRAVDFFEIGLTAPLPATYAAIARCAQQSVKYLPDSAAVMRTPSEVVDVQMTRAFSDQALLAAE